MSNKNNIREGINPALKSSVNIKSHAEIQDRASFLYNGYSITPSFTGGAMALSLRTQDWFILSQKQYDDIIRERETYFTAKFSRELFEMFREYQEMFYFYHLIGNAINWCGRLFPEQLSGRALSRLTGIKDHGLCYKLLREIIGVGLGEINSKGVLAFKSLQQFRTRKDYITIKFNKYETVKKGVNSIRAHYVTRRLMNQMTKAVKKYGRATSVASHNETVKTALVTLSNNTLAEWLNIGKTSASRFKKNYLTRFTFERDITNFGIPTHEEIKSIRHFYETGAVIVSKSGYVKHEGAHIVMFASASKRQEDIKPMSKSDQSKTRYELDNQILKRALILSLRYGDLGDVESLTRKLANRRAADRKWKIIKRQRAKMKMDEQLKEIPGRLCAIN